MICVRILPNPMLFFLVGCALAAGCGYEVSEIAPCAGPVCGGTPVTIRGSSFREGATVTFGESEATFITVVDSSKITAITPAGSIGNVDVTVTNPDETGAVMAAGFAYVPSGVYLNGDFEEGFSSGIGLHWTPFQSEGYGPLFSDGTDEMQWNRHSQKIDLPQSSSPGVASAGIFQRISLDPGTTYTVRVHAKTAFKGSEINPWDNIVASVGLDPGGGTDFLSPDVAWYEVDSEHDFWHTLSQEIVSEGPAVTLFLKAIRKGPWGGDDAHVWFDNVSLLGPNHVINGEFEGAFTDGLAASWQSWTTGGAGYWRPSGTVGRIGGGIYGNHPDAFAEVVSLNPKTLLLIEDILGMAVDLRAALPDTILIGRLYIDPYIELYLSDPEHYGAVHAENCYAKNLPEISAWQGFNEPDADNPDRIALVNRFEVAFAVRCRELGLKSCVLNLAVGNPGDMEKIYLFREALAEGDYVGYHSYGGYDDQLMCGPQKPWFALRWRKYVDMYRERGWRMPPVIYTECTTYFGWHGTDIEAWQVRDDLMQFEQEMFHDSWVAGSCIFVTGVYAGSFWRNWETVGHGILGPCGQWNASHPADARSGTAQQFGADGAAFTGGVRQAVDVVAGRDYFLSAWVKYEWYPGGVPDISIRLGYDTTGQLDDPRAAILHWDPDIVSAQSLEHDTWFEVQQVIRAEGDRLSLWLEASQPAPLPAFRISLDEVSLRPVEELPPEIPVDPTSFHDDMDGPYTDGTAPGWTRWEDPWGYDKNWEDADGCSGQAQRLRTTYSSIGTVRTFSGLEPYTDYTIRVWTRTSNSTGDGMADGWFEYGYDTTGQTASHETASVTWDLRPKEPESLQDWGVWLNYTLEFTTGPGTTLSVWTKGGSLSPTGMRCDFDDFEISPLVRIK